MSSSLQLTLPLLVRTGPAGCVARWQNRSQKGEQLCPNDGVRVEDRHHPAIQIEGTVNERRKGGRNGVVRNPTALSEHRQVRRLVHKQSNRLRCDLCHHDALADRWNTGWQTEALAQIEHRQQSSSQPQESQEARGRFWHRYKRGARQDLAHMRDWQREVLARKLKHQHRESGPRPYRRLQVFQGTLTNCEDNQSP